MITWALLFFSMLFSLWGIFCWAPTEVTMGDIQRIFYFHVSSAWNGFLAFFIVFISSILFLIRRKNIFDHIALASAEIGTLFTTFVLITGPLWAKPVWGIWWTWDARLTTTFLLWLIYGVYLLTRRLIVSVEKKRLISAVLGIIGFVDVPINYLSIRWWRTQHPSPVLGGNESSGLDPVMLKVLLMTSVSFMLLYFVLIQLRVNSLRLEEEMEKIRLNLLKG